MVNNNSLNFKPVCMPEKLLQDTVALIFRNLFWFQLVSKKIKLRLWKGMFWSLSALVSYQPNRNKQKKNYKKKKQSNLLVLKQTR